MVRENSAASRFGCLALQLERRSVFQADVSRCFPRELAALPSAAFVDALIDRTEAAASQYGGLADDVAVVHLGWKAAP